MKIDKRYHNYLKKMATEKEIESATIFDQQALSYTKRELLAFIVRQEKDKREKLEQHISDIDFVLSLNKLRR